MLLACPSALRSNTGILCVGHETRTPTAPLESCELLGMLSKQFLLLYLHLGLYKNVYLEITTLQIFFVDEKKCQRLEVVCGVAKLKIAEEWILQKLRQDGNVKKSKTKKEHFVTYEKMRDLERKNTQEKQSGKACEKDRIFKEDCEMWRERGRSKEMDLPAAAI